MKDKIITSIICSAFLLSGSISTSFAYSQEEPTNDELILAEVAQQNDLSDAEYLDDSVIVVLTNAASLQFNNYTVNNFSEIDAQKVENLTEYSTERLKEQFENDIPYDGSVTSVSANGFNQILEITLDSDNEESVEDIISELNQRDDVLAAQPNYIYRTESFVNDYLHNDQYAIFNMNLVNAWNLSTGDQNFKVGIIDTGINKNNPDLYSNYDSELSKSFVDRPAYESYGEHGTQIAGVIGAQGNNSIGITGVCWNVSLVSLKVESYDNQANSSNIIKAIQYAKEQNIKLINFSLDNQCFDYALYDELRTFKGLFVCSAGYHQFNQSQPSMGDLDLDIYNSYPTEFNLNNTISVASCSRIDRLSAISNFGKNIVDLVAPGEEIITTSAEGIVEQSSVSVATPQVTGVAALIWSKYPDLSAYEVKAAILNNVDKFDWLKDKVRTGGRLNAFEALYSIEEKTFTVKYDGNRGTGEMEDLIVRYGENTPLSANSFEKSGYDFAGWYVHRQSDNKWLYSNGESQEWYKEGQEEDGYTKFIYDNKDPIENVDIVSTLSPFDNDIITMYAQWNKKVYQLGDVNMDGQITIIDATLVQRYVAHLITLTDEQLLLADVNQDGAVTIFDASLIQMMVS